MAKSKKLKKSDLIKAGYRDKLKYLTSAEKDEIENGKVKYGEDGEPLRDKNGNIRRFERDDFCYYFKEVEGHEIRIYYVGDGYYWNNGRVSSPDQLPIIEGHARETAYYDTLQDQVQDTKPPEDTINTIVDERASKHPHVISLVGGPLDGQKRPWNKRFPFYMEQCKDDKITVAARYKRDKDNKELYTFEKSF